MHNPPNRPSRGGGRLRSCAGPLAAAACLAIAGSAQALQLPFTNGGGGADYSRWDSYLGTQSSQFSSLDQINTTNVAKLAVAWTFPTGGAPRFDPLVVGEVMYLVSQNNLVALNAATGKELWRKPVKGRIAGRGISYWKSKDGRDRRLIFLADGMLQEANADSGEPITSFGKDGKVDLRVGLEGDISKLRPLQTDNPGRIYKNLIIMSLPAGAYDYASSPADIHAYDILTGKLAWVFHVVPKKGEFGYESWPEKDHAKFGGVHNWSESTIDTERGILFIPTGTARYDFYGGNRAGDNLFANSILALDARTGKRLWHFQTVHHDLWDYDLPQAPKLMTITVDGKKIPALIQASKQGFVYVLDRRNGKPVWPIVERPVPASDVPGEKVSPTQPFPTRPAPFARQSFTEADINPHIPEADKAKVLQLLRGYRNEGLFTPPSLRGTVEMPGHNGGANWGSSAVNPQAQRFFVVSKELPTVIKLVPNAAEAAIKAMPNGGGDVTPYTSPVDFWMVSNGLAAIGPPWSRLTAYDMNKGEIIWQIPDGDFPPLAAQGIKDTGSHAPRGGPVATAGGLLFVGTSSDKKFRARDQATGKVLWEYDLPAASEGVPAVYQVGGRQFVVVPVGGSGAFSNQLDLPKPGQSQYIAFALPPGAAGGSGQ